MSADRLIARYRDRATSPGAFRPPAAYRQICRARAGGSPHARKRRTASVPDPCRPRRKSGLTKTRLASRQIQFPLTVASFSFLQIDLLRNTGSVFPNLWFWLGRRHAEFSLAHYVITRGGCLGAHISQQ